jgi:adenylate cyclase
LESHEHGTFGSLSLQVVVEHRMPDLKHQTFDELLQAAHEEPAARDEINRRYLSKAAILVVDFTDMVRRTDAYDIVYALSLARAAERVYDPAVRIHNGEMVKSVADSFFAVFTNPEDALAAALNGTKRLAYFNQARKGTLNDGSRNDPIHPCTGLGYGEALVIPGDDVYGAEVNRAFVLSEDVAVGREILASVRFMEANSEPPQGVGVHRAASDREEAAGFQFFEVQDFRE